MAILEGWDGGIYTSVGCTLTKMSNWKINFVAESQENTNFGATSPDRTFGYGLRSHTVEFGGYFENTATGQYRLVKKMLKDQSPTATSMVFLTNRTTGAKAGWKGAIFVESIGIDSPVDGYVKFSGSGKVSGGLTTYSS
jgi:hypothetical protein